MAFKIETWKDNKILRNKSEEITKNEVKKYALLWEEMIRFIKNPKNRWVWIAAPQIWVSKRLVCVSLLKDYDDTNFKTIFMINPEIIEFSKELEIDDEWCLSLPKQFFAVKRSKKIKVKYIDWKWKEVVLNLSWIPARIAQHEIDHLDGILFIDRIEQNPVMTDNNN